jgi:hypothetical protein
VERLKTGCVRFARQIKARRLKDQIKKVVLVISYNPTEEGKS